MADMQLSLKITADGSGLSGTLKTASGELRELKSAAESAGNATAQGMDKAAQASTRAGEEAKKAGAAVKEATGEIADGASRVAAASGEVRQAIDEVARGGSVAASTIGEAASAVGQAGNTIEQAASAIREAGSVSAQAVDQLGGAAREFIAEANAVRDAMAHEAKSLDDVAEKREWYAEALAKAQITQEEYTRASKALEAQEKRLQGAVGQTESTFGKLNLTTGAATRSYVMMVQQLARGDFAGFSRSLLTAASSTGVLRVGLLALGGMVGTVAAIVGAFALAAYKGWQETEQLRRSLIATGGYAGVTAEAVQNMGSALGESTGKIGAARVALGELVASGKVTRENLELAGRAAVDFATVTGKGAAEAAQAMTRIAEAPSRVVAELNQQYHFLDIATWQQIRSLEQQGRTTDAARVAYEAFGGAFAERSQRINENLGSIERGWNRVKQAASDAWDRMMNVGRPDTVETLRAQMDEAQQLLTVAQANATSPRRFGFAWLDGLAEADLANRVQFAANQVEAIGKKLADAIARDAKAAGDSLAAESQAAAIAAEGRLDSLLGRLDKNLAKQQQLNQAARDLYEIHKSGGTLPAGISFDGPLADQPVGPGWEKLKNEILETGKAMKLAAREAQALEQAQKALDDQIDALTGTQSAAAKAQSDYDKGMRQLAANVANYVAKGGAAADAERKWREGQRLLREQLDATNREISERGDILGSYLDRLAQEQHLRELPDRLRAGEEAVLAMADAYAKLDEAQRANLPTWDEIEAKTRSAAVANFDHGEAVRRATEAERDALQRSRQMWADWADAIFDAVARSGNFLKNLLANVKNIVIQILREWFKTRIVGMFTGGGGGGWAGMAMGAAGMAVSGGAFGSSGGGTGAAPGYAGSGGNFDFMSTNSWISAGKNLWNGFTSGYMSGGQYAGSSMFGTWTNGAQFAGDMGPGWAGASSYNPSALGYGAAIAGGAYAGYQRWQGSNKDFAGGVGAAAYGVGTYSAAIGAGAAMTGGAMAGLAAIPVVGWIAIAAMLVDMISGGKLFGTGFRPNDVKQDIGVRPDGAYAAVTMGEVRQTALFGGREWRDKPMDVPPEMLEAAERFYKQIEKVMVDGARKLAIDTPAMIDATIRTQSELDKKGNVKSTKYIVQTLGREWEEASAELAATRVSAEAIVATVAASEAGHAASQIAEQWRYSAEVLMDGAQMMLAATTDIVKGRGLLSHGTGLDPAGAVGLPSLPPGAGGGGGGGGPGDAGPPMLVKDAVSEANDELARTVALVQELAHADEKLADAYTRLAQDANLLQQALDLAGVTIDKTAEDFVRLAAGIEEAAGGLQQAQALWQGFFEAFYGQAELGAQHIALMRQDVTAQLAGLGLDATTTMEQFRAEFESKLPTLSADEIVQWLQAGNALANLTSATAQLAMQVSQVLGPMGLMGQGLSGFGQALVAIKQQESAAIDAANALAKSRGAEGASAIQLAAIHQWTARQIAAAIRQLQAETRRLVADLYGDVPGSLDLINQRIGELEGAANGAAGGIDQIADASDNLFERWRAGVQSVQDYLDSMLLGDLSALTPEEQLAEAQRQLIEMQAAAMGGDADALARLPQLADAYLRLARGSLASGEDYNAQFGWVRQLLTAVTELRNPGTQPGVTTPGAGGGTVQIAPSPELEALYAARDAALAEQETAYRAELAQQLASHLADLAVLLNVPILELIEAQGVNLKELATDLGVDLANLNAASIEALGGMALTLGVPLGELVERLGLSLPDLKEGLTELVGSLGINLQSLTGETATQLAALAGSLGTNLRDLSTALGIDLGKLTDINSPIFQALEANIGSLSPDIKTELTPLLDAVKNAAGDEQKNEAVKALRDHVDQMAPEIKTLLGPFFDDIMPPQALGQLDYLEELRSIANTTLGVARNQLDVMARIANNLKAANDDAGIPSYAVGTPWVQGDQVAQIHHGEAVVPAAVNQWLRTTGWRVGGGTGGDVSLIVAELKQVNDRLDRLDRNNSAGHAAGAAATTREGERARTQRDDIARRQSQDLRRIA